MVGLSDVLFIECIREHKNSSMKLNYLKYY